MNYETSFLVVVNREQILNCPIRVAIYLLKVNNGNARTMCGICSKVTIKTSELPLCNLSGVCNVEFEQVNVGKLS